MGKVRQWKNGGKEDQMVEKWINDGTVTTNTKSNTLKTLNPHGFGAFSNNVIRNHLNELKRRNGVFLNDENEGGGENVDDMDNEEETHQHNNTNATKVKSEYATSDSLEPVVQLEHNNFPFICETYKDPVTRMDVVLIMVNLPGGAQNVQVELNVDGTEVSFKYIWAKAWYDVKELFKKFIASKQTTLVHPMVLSVESALEKCRSHIDTAPEATMKIKLPMRVQTDPYSWKKNGIIREDGMQIVMIEFIGFVKEYHKVKENGLFVFDK